MIVTGTAVLKLLLASLATSSITRGPITSAGTVTFAVNPSPGSRSTLDANAAFEARAWAIVNPPEPLAETAIVDPATTTVPSAGAVIATPPGIGPGSI